MKLLFDGAATQPIAETLTHGGGEYAERVLNLILKAKSNSDIVVFFDKNRPLNKTLLDNLSIRGVKVEFISSDIDVADLINRQHIETFYSALPYNYFNVNNFNCRTIFVLHGLRSLEMPYDNYEPYYGMTIKQYTKFLIRKNMTAQYRNKIARRFNLLLRVSPELEIHTPSLHTKASIKNFLDIPPDVKSFVYYSPLKDITPKHISSQAALDYLNISERKYFLLVSGNRWIKNSYRALLGIDDFLKKENNLEEWKVVITGGATLKFKKFFNKERFLFLDYIGDTEIESLYSSAGCLVYPSLNEGFGYPPIEAMKYNTPVIASAISSIPEICGEGAIYFNPFDIQEIKNRIYQALDLAESHSNNNRTRYDAILNESKAMLSQMITSIIN